MGLIKGSAGVDFFVVPGELNDKERALITAYITHTSKKQ